LQRWSPVAEDGTQRRKGRLQAGEQIMRRAPILWPQAAHGLLPAGAGGNLPFGVAQRAADAVEAASEVHVAKGGDLEGARGAASSEGVEAEPRQRVLEQRHDRGR
jgi:hypothetical protein